MRNFELHSEKQERAFYSEKDIILCAAGIQWGKSWLGALRTRLLASRYNNKDDNFIVAAPTYKVLEQSTKRAFLNVFGDIGRFYKSDGIYQIKNGPTFYFRSGHDPDSVVGITNVRGVWGDEAGLFTKYFADNLFARAAFRNAQVIFTTSPYSLNWILKDIINPTLKGNRDDVELIQAQSCENPYFPRAVYEKRRLTMDPRRFKTIYGGEFDRPEGMVYDCWDEDIIHIDKFICDSPSTTNFYCGLDWGWNDPFVLITRAISDHGIHTDVSEFVKPGLTPSKIVEFVKSKHSIHHYKMVFCDPSRPEMIEELCSAGIPAVAAENDIREGIDAYYELISSGNYRVVAKDCPYLIDEKDSYHYPEEKDLKTDQNKSKKNDIPVDQNNHCVDENTLVITDKGDVKIRDINIGDRVLTRIGYQKVTKVWDNGIKDTVLLKYGRYELICTSDHKIFTENKGFVRSDSLRYDDSLCIFDEWKIKKQNQSFLMVSNTIDTQIINNGLQLTILGPVAKKATDTYIGPCGLINMGKYRPAIMCIIRMVTLSIIQLKILSVYLAKSILKNIGTRELKTMFLWIKSKKILKKLDPKQASGIVLKKVLNGISNTVKKHLGQKIEKKLKIYANVVGKYILPMKTTSNSMVLNFAPIIVNQNRGEDSELITSLKNVNIAKKNLKQINIRKEDFAAISVQGNTGKRRVFDISVENQHEYFANGILISNCLDATRYLTMGTRKVDKKTEIKQTDINYRLRKLGKKNIGRFSI